MLAALASLLLTLQPYTPILTAHVDLVEVNHLYDGNGVLIFDQVIFYDWCDLRCNYNVAAWRMANRQANLPVRDWRRGGWSCVWAENHMLRHVKAASIRESWTQFDPELDNRDYLPVNERRQLGSKP